MSKTIEERIVGMEFDNSNFEKNVKTSLNTIDKLKSSLNFSDATKSLENLERTSSSFSMSPMGKVVDSIKEKFSAFEVVGITALANITNSAINTGKQLIKSLSIDQITAGFSKYEEITSATQTIMSATGKSIEDVEAQLNKLNWFTDETSYNLTDMTSNVGKFTSAGVDLEKAVSAMEGIATAAALSGTNAAGASRAMYNFSQALGMGSVKTQDWMSIENANMATKEFKETIIETAKELGNLDSKGKIIKKTSDKYSGDEIVSFQNFRNTLAAGWFDSDVLIKSLKKYGDFSDKLNEAMNKTNLDVTSDMLRYIDQYKDGTIDMEVASKNAGVSAKELGLILKELGSSEYDLGRRAFKAAQEAKTFTEAMDATKDAVSTKWMTTFKLIFGNYEEAKELWTDIANAMYDVFAASGDVRNAILAEWKELGGRDDLIDSFWNLWDAISSIVAPIKEAFRDIFPPITAKNLYNFTKNLKDLTSKLKIGDETAEKLRKTFGGVFAVFDILKQALSGFFRFISSVRKGFGSLGDGILDTTSSFGEYLIALDNLVKKSELFNKIAEFFSEKLEVVINFIKNIKELLPKIDLSFFTNSIDNLSEKLDSFNSTGEKTKSIFEKLSEFFSKIVGVLAKVKDFIGKLVTTIHDKLAKFINSFDLGKATKVFEGGFLTSILIYFVKFLKSFKDFAESGQKIKDSIVGILSSVKDVLSAWQKQINSKTLLKIAEAVGILAISLLVLSMINPEKLGTSLVAITGLFVNLIGAFKILSKSSDGIDGKALNKATSSMIKMSVALLIVSIALKKVASIDSEKLVGATLAITTLMLSLTACVKTMSQNSKDAPKIGSVMLTLSISLLIISKAVKKLGELDPINLAKGVGAVIILLSTMMGILIGITRLSGDATKGSMIIMSLSLSLLIVSTAVKKLGELKPTQLAKGIGSVIILLSAMMGVLIGITKLGGKNASGAGAALILIATSLLIVLQAVKQLSNLEPSKLAKGIGAVIILLSAMMGVLIGISKLAPNAIKASTSLLIVSAALIVIAGAIKLLGSMKMSELAKGLGSIVVFLVAFIGAAAIVQSLGLVPILLGLSGAIALFGIACLSVGTGIFMLSTGLAALAVSGVAGGMALVTVITMLIDLIPLILQKVGEGIVRIVQVFTDSIPEFVNCGLSMILALLQGINDNMPDIVATGLSILTNLINGIAEGLPDLIDAGWNLAISFVNGIADGIDEHSEEFNTAVHRMLVSMWNALLDFLGIHSPSTKTKGVAYDFIAGFVKGVGEKIESVRQKVREVGEAALSKIKEKSNEWLTAGKNLIGGFIKGINQKIQDVKDAAKEIGGKALSSLKDKLGIESPSKEGAEIGKYTDLGVVKGLLSFSSKVYDAGSSVGEEALKSMTMSISKVSNIFDYMDDYSPTITPVLDTSYVEAGYNDIESMFNANKSLSFKNVVSVSSSVHGSSNNGKQNESAESKSVVNNFTQNNYSPKSLSKAEIYRNTKTLFAKEKGVVSVP